MFFFGGVEVDESFVKSGNPPLEHGAGTSYFRSTPGRTKMDNDHCRGIEKGQIR